MYWFISDTHFGHANILKYCNRPFSTLEEMDATLIKNWNERVKAEDTVFFLGDFCFCKSSEAPDSQQNAFEYYRSQLNGNIIFIRGNHDGNNRCKSIIDSIHIKHGGHRIHLTHNPKFAQSDYFWNFCGHKHGSDGRFTKIDRESFVIDLSVDCWDFRPVDVNEINQSFSEWYRRGCKDEESE